MTQTSKYIISEANLDEDWDDLFATYWDSWKQPLQAVGQLTFVGIGTGGETEEKAFVATKEQYLVAARENPDQSWVKIEDPARDGSGLSRIIGGGFWTLHRENPFRSHRFSQDQAISTGMTLPGPQFEAGTERDRLQKELYHQMGSWRPRLMSAAHAYGQGIWVLPEYRHKGAAEASMDYWMDKVDSLGIEAYLEASSLGVGLYLQYGFIVTEYPTLVFSSDNPSPDWLGLVRDIQSHPLAIMWRPKGGKYVEGKTVMPWQGTPRKAKL
ncbi:hypothetical protein F5Y14DRAFT_458702 [Nemania sp. NC0429]|nr:hypothetical protein F5Y14DRAFT_458702 [Nemania sp. NC0429]